MGAPLPNSNCPAGSDDGVGAGGVLLADSDGPADVLGFVLVAPVAQRLLVEQVELEPGELLAVDEGEQDQAAHGVEAGDAEGAQLLEGLLVAGAGAVAVVQG